MSTRESPGFGRLLRQWRQARGMSQIALAVDAEISIRHLSFLETGRAQPSRAMVERLGTARPSSITCAARCSSSCASRSPTPRSCWTRSGTS